MQTKRCAIFLIFLISCEHARQVAATAAIVAPGFPPFRAKRAICILSPEASVIVDATLENIRRRCSNDVPIQDQNTGEIRLTGGTSTGWQNFTRTGPIKGICTHNTLNLCIEISYLSVVISYTLNLVEGLLEGLLGGILSGLGSSLTNLLGNVVNVLLRILVLDIRTLVTVEQLLVPGARCVMVKYTVQEVSSITILNLELAPVASLLRGVLVPVLNLVLNDVLTGSVRNIFFEEIGRMSIPLNLINLG